MPELIERSCEEAAKESSKARLASLWWTMHHSDSDTRETVMVRCYLDESGTDDLSPTAVVGGLLLNRQRFLSFPERWLALLARHGVEPPLHMKDFGRPHGRLAWLRDRERAALFSGVTEFVNEHKVISVAATLSTRDYNEYFSGLLDKRKQIGVYGMCFMLCVMVNHRLAESKNYREKIAYLLDQGNPYKHHILDAYTAMSEVQRTEFLNLGTLAFGDDREALPLQAADVIAWSVRRSLAGQFVNGFEPLERLFDDNHVQAPFSKASMQEMANALRAWLENESPA